MVADHPRTVHSGTFISLTVSVSGIVLTEMSSGEMISKHDMQGISFASGGEKVSSNVYNLPISLSASPTYLNLFICRIARI
jgi:hypothetical protein